MAVKDLVRVIRGKNKEGEPIAPGSAPDSFKLVEVEEAVQKSWVFKLSWKMQTVINQGLRAPDTHFCPNVKIVCRWMRSVVLNNADDEHTFMCRQSELPTFNILDNELNYCSVHFATHFLYALEIIGYKHPDEDVRRIAIGYYANIVESLWHLNAEQEREMDIRLADVTREEPPAPCPPRRRDSYLR